VSAGSRTLERDRPRLTGRAAALLVVIALLALLALVPTRQFLAQRGRIADLEASGDDPAQREAVELRDALRLGRLLLAGQEVTL